MELKVWGVARLYSTFVRFNRTFMELKDSRDATTNNGSTFQSHLYGIESSIVRSKLLDTISVSIAPLWNWKQPTVTNSWIYLCFNRTFMELKEMVSYNLLRRFKFQSHLYGIESLSDVKVSDIPFVSIAPLWNWKTVLMPILMPVIGFNRTFMELKVWMLLRLLALVIKFQSHLYGIESCLLMAYHINLKNVSIAPLWNWKPCRAFVSCVV